MDGWSGKKGQNGTRQVGWLIKKGRPIFESMIGENNFEVSLLSNFLVQKL